MKTQTDKLELYKVKYPSFAKKNSIPMVFVAEILKQTEKALYLHGKGVLTKNKLKLCSICGKMLTNQNSIKLGIGPICASKYNIDLLSGYTDKDIEKELHKIEFIKWIPKSCFDILGLKNADSIPIFEKDIQTHTQTTKSLEIYEKQAKKAIKKDNQLCITFPFDAVTVTNIKTLSGRRYKKEPEPHWICPDTEENRIDLKSWGFDVPEPPELEKEKKPVKIPPFPKHLENILFPYQKESIQFLFEREGRGLLGLDMGLGKSLISLIYSFMNPKVKKTLIICPASLKLNWASEISKWLSDFDLYVLNGKPNIECKAKKADFSKFQIVSNKNAKKEYFVINYDILGNKEDKQKGKKRPVEHLYTGWIDYLIDYGFDLVIGDEIHFIKNQASQRSKAVTKIGKIVPEFVPMSGTPIINRPIEFWTCLNTLCPGMFNNYWNYAKRYCNAKHNGYGWDFTGASNTTQLNQILQNIMIRRKKEDVLKELPPKIISVVPMEVNNYPTYKKAEKDLIAFLRNEYGDKKAEKAKQAEALVKIETLKQLVWEGKKKACLEWINDYLNTNDKLIVFGVHKATLDFIEQEFKDISVKIDGSTKNEDRQKHVEIFQNNPDIKLFIGNIKAAGVGLTLTASNCVAFLEEPWTPGDVDQCSDRAHRIGQLNTVNVYHLIGDKTIELDILNMLDEKRKVLNAVLDGKQEKEVSLIDILLKNKGE